MKLNGSGQRPPEWTWLLAEFIERRRDHPFTWGQNDCATFALDWLALARPDLAPRTDLADMLDYDDADGAVHALNGTTLAQLVDGWAQLLPVAVNYAQRGDLVLIDTGGRLSLAVCVGDLAAGPGSTGLVLAPMTEARRAWRV